MHLISFICKGEILTWLLSFTKISSTYFVSVKTSRRDWKKHVKILIMMGFPNIMLITCVITFINSTRYSSISSRLLSLIRGPGKGFLIDPVLLQEKT